jgi:ribosomal protein S12 methylthiotransferase accessory factor YcaO
VSKNKLGYTDKEARHIFIGEYIEQFEVFKKYHNIEMTQTLFTDEEKEEKAEEKPQWVVDEERKKDGK